MLAAKNEIKFEQPSDLLILANRFILVIVAIVVLVVLALGYFFILQPSINNIKSQNSATQESAYLQSKHEELLFRLKELRAEYEDIKNNREDVLDKLQSIIPNNPRTAELFVMAEKMANDHGLILSSMEIVNNQQNDSTVATSTSVTANFGGANNLPPGILQNNNSLIPSNQDSLVKLKSLIIHMVLMTPALETDKEGKAAVKSNAGPTESTYSVFKKYLNDLEHNLRLMDIQTVSFGPLDGESSSVNFGVSLIAYYK